MAAFPASSPHSQAPASWEERGVLVPFTAPPLFGARVRPTPRGEMYVVPNPSGARGHYVVSFAACAGFAVPTIHDRLLAERIATLEDIAPAAVREATIVVATSGAAGEPAKQAAVAARARDGVDKRQAALGAALARSAGLPTSDLAALAEKLGRTADALATDLAGLAGGCAGLNLPGSAEPGYLARTIDRLREVSAAIDDWGGAGADRGAALARAVSGPLRRAADLGAEALARTAQFLDALPGLLGRWRTDPATVARELARPHWILDGWGELACLWTVAETPREKRTALADMARLLPPWPSEIPPEPGRVAAAELARNTLADEVLPDLQARNERVVALLP